MGSEMCIRDRDAANAGTADGNSVKTDSVKASVARRMAVLLEPCLLYTSDAADERSSVDLGGRRIINKKTKKKHRLMTKDHEYG